MSRRNEGHNFYAVTRGRARDTSVAVVIFIFFVFKVETNPSFYSTASC